MASKRRESTLELADALGLEVPLGEATSELMGRCIARARDLRGLELTVDREGIVDLEDAAEELSAAELVELVPSKPPKPVRARKARQGSRGRASERQSPSRAFGREARA